MDYQDEKDIRKKSFGTLLGEQEGGLGTSLKKTLSLKSQARMSGIKETFDPMNLAKKATFGSNWAPAMVGKMMGRDQKSMEYFTGAKFKKGSTTPIDDVESGSTSEPVKLLGLIYKELLQAQEYRKLQQEEENNRKKEKDKEESSRDEQLIEAVTGRKPRTRAQKKAERRKRRKEEKKEAPPTKEVPKGKGKEEKKEAPKGKEEAPKAPTEKPPKAPTKEAPKAPEKVPEKEVPKEAPKAPEKVPPKEAPTPKTEPTTTPVSKPSAPKPSAGKIPSGVGSLTGRAAQVAVALGSLGITSKAAIGAIVATSAKESNLDPFKPEDGAKPWLNTLNGKPKVVNGKTLSPLEYIYTKFPQLGPGGRVAKQLNMPNGVPEDYIRETMAKGDEAWFTLVYPGGADAYKYRGRGLIQITGKGVYKAVGDIIGVDLEKDPDAITRDFDTAAKATGAYLMNSIGLGDSKKGLAALNGLTDEKEALKMVIANVARGNAGSDKNKIDKMFDPSTNLGKTTASQLEAASKYTQLGSDAANGNKIDQASKENKDLKEALNKDKATNTLNNTTNIKQTTDGSKAKTEQPDDTNPYLKKARA